MAKSPNTNPHISINKLAEFMSAKPARQRQILRDQKYPTDFKGMYYKEATETISHAIASNLEDLDSIDKAIDILEQMSPEKIGTQRRIAANIDALETFRDMLDKVDITGATPIRGGISQPKLSLMGVEISVRPEIILKLQGKTKQLIGAIKLHFPRTFPISDDSSGYLSAVLQEWAKIAMPDDGAVSGAHCYVIDIGASRVYTGVKATANRMRDIEAVCENIAALWPTIKPSP